MKSEILMPLFLFFVPNEARKRRPVQGKWDNGKLLFMNEKYN